MQCEQASSQAWRQNARTPSAHNDRKWCIVVCDHWTPLRPFCCGYWIRSVQRRNGQAAEGAPPVHWIYFLSVALRSIVTKWLVFVVQSRSQGSTLLLRPFRLFSIRMQKCIVRKAGCTCSWDVNESSWLCTSVSKCNPIHRIKFRRYRFNDNSITHSVHSKCGRPTC